MPAWLAFSILEMVLGGCDKKQSGMMEKHQEVKDGYL